MGRQEVPFGEYVLPTADAKDSAEKGQVRCRPRTRRLRVERLSDGGLEAWSKSTNRKGATYCQANGKVAGQDQRDAAWRGVTFNHFARGSRGGARIFGLREAGHRILSMRDAMGNGRTRARYELQ